MRVWDYKNYDFCDVRIYMSLETIVRRTQYPRMIGIIFGNDLAIVNPASAFAKTSKVQYVCFLVFPVSPNMEG